MKKFRFGLDSVLSSRQQVLEGRQNEYGKAMRRVQEQRMRLEAVQQRYQETNQQFREEAAAGISIADAMGFEVGLRALEREIARETKALRDLEAEAEKRRIQMLQAHQDAAMLEKLKEKKQEDYRKAEQKQDELFIDELVSAVRAGRSDS